jgi:hypothetical protein
MHSEDLAIRIAQKLTQKAVELHSTQKLGTLEWAHKYIPHYFTRSVSALHTQLARTSDEIKHTRGKNTLVIAPRGNAKSTLCSLTTPLQATCEGTEKFILLVADTADQAKKYLASIKDELLFNEELRKDYPLACQEGDIWNSERIETKNGVCIEAIGKGGAVRGRKFRQYRPTLIIVDDPQSDEDCLSPVTRTKDIDWFNKSLMPAGDKDTNIFVVGTMLHRDCIVGALEKRADFSTVKFASIIAWPVNMHLWAEWGRLYFREKEKAKQFYIEHKSDMHEGAKVLWEDKEDIYELMCLRENIGDAAFKSEKQNDPRDPSKCEFREEWLSEDRAEIWYATLPTNKKLISVGYGDPAMGGETKKHDDSAIVSLFYDHEERCCYVEVELEKRPVNIFIESLIKHRKLFKYEAFGLETNGFQQLVSENLYSADPLFPTVEIENRVNKMVRISRLGIWLQRGFFRFKIGCKHTHKLISQLLEHPHAAHDDGSDALEGATRTLSTVVDIDEETEEANVNTQDDGLGDNILGGY